MTSHSQTRFIADARELLRPSPVRTGHVPRWLCRRIRERTACRGFGQELLGKALALVGARFDHEGSTTLPSGELAFVSEPYATVADIRAAERFAKLLGLELRIDPCGWWYPGRTLRLAFTLPGELYDQQAKERQKLSCGRGQKGVVTVPHLNEQQGKSRDLAGKSVGA